LVLAFRATLLRTRPVLLLLVILASLVRTICASSGSSDAAMMSGKMANNAAEDRTLNAAALFCMSWGGNANGS
jgi:hypothetical protein